jgi:hypothetical protein
MTSTRTCLVAAALVLAAAITPAYAQEPAVAGAQSEPDTAPVRNDRAVDPAQPDFTLVALPTTLRIPRFGSSFRVTHRFNRPLAQGSFGDLLSDAFGMDSGARIGLEYRFGLMSGTQLGFYRTSDRTIEFFVQQHIVRQGSGKPVGIDALVSAEGTNNFKDSYSPAIGGVISRTFGRPSELADDNSTFVIGFGGRVRVRPTVYLVAEAAPRVGYRPDTMHASFAIEKRAGGHSFQLNFSNGLGSTLAQVARGGVSNDNWYFGFNLSRKFF